MSDQNIFGSNTNENQNGGTPPNSNVQPNSFDNLLDSIKNERGERKYADINTAFGALKASQDYIPQLKTELDSEKAARLALEAEVQRLKTIEDTVTKLTSQGTP